MGSFAPRQLPPSPAASPAWGRRSPSWSPHPPTAVAAVPLCVPLNGGCQGLPAGRAAAVLLVLLSVGEEEELGPALGGIRGNPCALIRAKGSFVWSLLFPAPGCGAAPRIPAMPWFPSLPRPPSTPGKSEFGRGCGEAKGCTWCLAGFETAFPKLPYPVLLPPPHHHHPRRARLAGAAPTWGPWGHQTPPSKTRLMGTT